MAADNCILGMTTLAVVYCGTPLQWNVQSVWKSFPFCLFFSCNRHHINSQQNRYPYTLQLQESVSCFKNDKTILFHWKLKIGQLTFLLICKKKSNFWFIDSFSHSFLLIQPFWEKTGNLTTHNWFWQYIT